MMSPKRQRSWHLLKIMLPVQIALAGCLGTPVEPPEPPQRSSSGSILVPEEPVLCSDPVSVLQFHDEAAERGLLLPSWLPTPPSDEEGRGLSASAFGAEDYDGDGDIDIVVFDLMAHVYLNDGTGHFEIRQLVQEPPSGGGNAWV